MNIYDIGDIVRLLVSFTNSAGQYVDPSSLTLQYKKVLTDPSSFRTLVYGVDAITRVNTGNYFHDFDVRSAGLLTDLQGEWRYRWNGLGANAGAGEKSIMFSVRGVG